MAVKDKILVIYPIENDPQSVILYEELYNAGAEPILFPFSLTEGSKKTEVYYSGERLIAGSDIADVKAVYIRGLASRTPLAAPPYLNEYEFRMWQAKYLRENIKINVLNSLMRILEMKGALIINPLRTYLHHNTKVNFNLYLSENGINVPKTFGTSDSKFLDKIIEKDKKLILKSPSGIGATRRVDKGSMNKDYPLRYSPTLFQDEIEGSTIRVHTVGNKSVLALRILADDIDSRTDTAGFEYVELSKKHERMIAKANNLLGWKFSAWDVIIDANDKIFLLDGNPGPYIYWIGDHLTRVVMKSLQNT